jgi:hypothetical protein
MCNIPSRNCTNSILLQVMAGDGQVTQVQQTIELCYYLVTDKFTGIGSNQTQCTESSQIRGWNSSRLCRINSRCFNTTGAIGGEA